MPEIDVFAGFKSRMIASPISLTFSVADQNFRRTKSIGILNVSLQLLEHLAKNPGVDRITVLTNSGLEHRVFRDSRVAHHLHNSPSTRLGRIFWDQIQVYRLAEQSRNPWLFLPKGFASFLRKPAVRLITYVHDVIPQYYDEKYPQAISRLERWYFRASFGATLRHSTIVFTNSEFTKSEVERAARLRGIPVPHVVVAGIGFARPGGLAVSGREGVIALSSHLPHKRTDLAVEYLARWQTETGYSGPVHWIGSPPQTVRYPEFANWRLHSRIPEAEYRALMAQARVENQSYPSFARAMKEALAASTESVHEWADTILKEHEWRVVAERIVGALLAHEAR